MNCNDYEPILAAYAAGDLSKQEAEATKAHLEACDSCRGESQAYSLMINAIASAPEIVASPMELSALAKALDSASLVEKPAPESDAQWQGGMQSFLKISAAVFALIVAALTAQAVGWLSVRSLSEYVKPPVVVLAAVIIIFVTSFVPIAVTAKRRPLNGMTFRG
jgi:anti-sigma factor RsiW